jgi:FkbM family methyltransferase
VGVVDNLRRSFVADIELAVPEFGGVFSIDVRSDLFVRLAIDGFYEPDLAKLCTSHLDPQRDAIDVGANIGFFSVHIARQLAPGRRVLALEPTPNALDRLRSNLVRNKVASAVEVFEGVAASEEGQITLTTFPGREEYSTIVSPTHPSVQDAKGVLIVVQANTIDRLVELGGLDPGFLKIDAEGAEHLVLTGARATLRRFRPVVMVEITNSTMADGGGTQELCFKLLSEFGYRIFDADNMTQASPTGRITTALCLPG